jgi:hypothetical protein
VLDLRRSTIGSHPSKCHTNVGFDAPVDINRLGRAGSLPPWGCSVICHIAKEKTICCSAWTDFRILLNSVQFAANQQLRVRFISDAFWRS